ncbi:MAG: MarR family transcriptional regulator [Oscillospiraceae bacterium]|nr:MarR family transcriptional regulator [Oscillospiraceae bacterium]
MIHTGKQTILALHHLNRAVKHRIESSEIKQDIDHLTGTYGWVMVYLSEHEGEDVYQRVLEKEFGICRSGVSKIVADLEKKQLIERSKVACDDRLKKIVLTERGKALTQRIREDQERLETALTRGFSQEELNTVQQFLNRMQNNITTEN